MKTNEKETALKILQEQYEYAIRKASEWEQMHDQSISMAMKTYYDGMADGLRFAIATMER